MSLANIAIGRCLLRNITQSNSLGFAAVVARKSDNISCRKYSQDVSAPDPNIIKVEKLSGNQEGITIVGMNRPEARNALSRKFVATLASIIQDINNDKGVRVVIIRSLVPGIFCAGADLKERLKLTQEEVTRNVPVLRGTIASVERIPVPVIAAIDGPALGGGLELGLACDIRTAAEDARMGLVETSLAIIPGAGGTQRLPRILNPSIAKELIFTSKVFTGKEAYEMGIVNHVCKQNETKDAAFKKALEIANKILPNGPVGVRMAKKAIDDGLQVDLTTGYTIEEACYRQTIPTKDRIEALKAFGEKRKPRFTGE